MSRYSAIVMDHFQSPRNLGRMADADVVGVAGVPGRGRYLVLYLKLVGDVVERALFECHGCGATIAAGSVLTEICRSKSLAACGLIGIEMLLSELGGLPPDKRYCADFAVNALKDALQQVASRLSG